MTSVDIELEVHRKNTELFIDNDPTLITLVPEVTSWSGGSKKMSDGPNRPEQKFKVIYPGGDQTVTTSDGTTKKLDFILVGLFDATVHIGDHWTEDTQVYRIQEIDPFNGYEVKAKGVTIGGSPAHG